MWAERYYKLLTQEFPSYFKGVQDIDDFVHYLATYWLVRHKNENDELSIYAENLLSDNLYNTIAYCEDMYVNGYSAIINDGKLVGFRREKIEEK